MNKQELINAIVERSDSQLTKKATNECVDLFVSVVKDQVSSGDSITLVGFGTFACKTRKARLGRNPRTGEHINIPEQKVPHFSATATFKKEVAEK